MRKMCTGIQNAEASDDDDVVGEAARCDTHPGVVDMGELERKEEHSCDVWVVRLTVRQVRAVVSVCQGKTIVGCHVWEPSQRLG